jgi:gamma-glutamylcyclotransferase (GGCT)/AIG2-like uncharacterized protein YtfP
MSNKRTHLVMVYGTLQSGFGNNDVMTGGGDAKLLGKATTLQKFYMSDGGFPRIAKRLLGQFTDGHKPSDYFGQVAGELWEVDGESFAACDRLEGHPRFYRREEVPVTLDKGKVRHKAWIYVIVSPFLPRDCILKNTSGVLQWRERMARA